MMMRSTSITANSKMIGEMSMPPVVSRKLRIGRRNGSVSARNRFQTAAHEIVADVDDAECDQPRQHRAGYDHQLVEIERVDDDIEDRTHEFSTF